MEEVLDGEGFAGADRDGAVAVIGWEPGYSNLRGAKREKWVLYRGGRGHFGRGCELCSLTSGLRGIFGNV
jgi:hypothetical protein